MPCISLACLALGVFLHACRILTVLLCAGGPCVCSRYPCFPTAIAWVLPVMHTASACAEVAVGMTNALRRTSGFYFFTLCPAVKQLLVEREEEIYFWQMWSWNLLWSYFLAPLFNLQLGRSGKKDQELQVFEPWAFQHAFLLCSKWVFPTFLMGPFGLHSLYLKNDWYG